MHVEGGLMWTLCVYDIGRFTDAACILLRKEYLGNQKICRSRDFFSVRSGSNLAEDKSRATTTPMWSCRETMRPIAVAIIARA